MGVGVNVYHIKGNDLSHGLSSPEIRFSLWRTVSAMESATNRRTSRLADIEISDFVPTTLIIN